MASSEPTPRKRLAGVRGLERLRLRYAQKRDLRSIWCLFNHRGRVTEWSVIAIGAICLHQSGTYGSGYL